VVTNGTSTPTEAYSGKDPGGSLESAIAYCSRGVRPDGSYDGVPEGEVSPHQWRLLGEWARNGNLILPSELSPEREGGREDDVRFDESSQRWLKFTKPWLAGFTVEVVGESLIMLPATPLQYLHRWRAANRDLGDDAQLVGIAKDRSGDRIVISQLDTPGDPASWDEIDKLFAGE
jgi:hypothetical protein